MNRWILAACGLVFAISTSRALAATSAAMGPTPPVAEAGPDQQVYELSLVTLDGTGSYDPDPGTVLQYTWTQVYGPSVVLNGANTAQPTFITPEVHGAGTTFIVFDLRVRDETGAESSDFVAILVGNAPGAPVANAGPDQSVNEGAGVTLNGTGSTDPQPSDVLSYQWTQLAGPAVTLTGATTAQPTFTAPNVTFSERLTFQLTVSDGVYSSSDTVDVLVSHVDLPPVADAGPDQTVASNSIVTLNGLGSSDPDSGQSIRQYAWTQLAGPPVTLIPTVTRPTPQFVAPTVTVTTVLTFELTVWDQQFLSSTDTVNITVVP